MSTSDSGLLNSETATTARSAVQRRWGWLLLLGIVQVICGALALVIPVAASLAAVLVLGAVLIVSGVLQTVHAFSVKARKHMALQAIGGIVYLIAGVFVLLFPLSSALTLTVMVGAVLIADGVLRIVVANRLKPRDSWGWFLAAGIASTAVGILLLIGWPFTGFWAIGILLGASLLVSGVINCALAVTFRVRNAREPLHETLNNLHRHA